MCISIGLLTGSCSVEVLTSCPWLLAYCSRLFSCWMIRLTSSSSLLKKRSSCPTPNARLAALASWVGMRSEWSVLQQENATSYMTFNPPNSPEHIIYRSFKYLFYIQYTLGINTSPSNVFHRFDNSSDLQFGLWKEKDAHLFLLFPTQMFCKEMKQCHEYYSGSLLSYRLQHKRSQFNHFGNRSISFSHLHCLQPGSPAVKLSFCLLPAGFSFCPFSLRPPFLVTLARTCLCCGAEWKQIIFIIKILNLSLKMLGQWCVCHF